MAISLFPTPFPVDKYELAKELQPHFGTLLANMVRQPSLILDALKYYYKTDDFLKRLIDISKAYAAVDVQERQNHQMLILRSDYMLDRESNELKLVEFNTIAAALTSLSQKVCEVQGQILDKYSDKLNLQYSKRDHLEDGFGLSQGEQIGIEFKRGIQLYFESMKKSDRGYTTSKIDDVWVLFIVEENERNLGDQKCLESELYDRQGIKTLRATFAEVWKTYEIDPASRALRVQGREIGLVYYRTGYQ